MKKLFELGNRYAAQSTWRDFALTKLCLFSMGITAGMVVPKKYRTRVIGAAAAGFAVSYIPLMAKVFKIAGQMKEQ